ncbi:MAG: methyltransferase, TIGR04325 family [Bacteroidota bacterium]
MSKFNTIIKDLIPPIIVKQARSLFYGWSGNYSTWQHASSKCTGYDTAIIFNKVKNAILKVKNGEAVYERDSILFDKVHYSFPLLSALSYVALRNNNKLNILDFGGSLGSSYYQNRHLYNELSEFNWCIVEQKHFVTEGEKTFADQHLHFYYDIDTCMKDYRIDILLLSSVLQYIEEPYKLLDFILSKNIEYIIIDRTPLLLEGKDRITIQTVPKNIYEAKYPCWLLNEKNIQNKFLSKYEMIFDTELSEAIHLNNAAYKSFFFKRKK